MVRFVDNGAGGIPYCLSSIDIQNCIERDDQMIICVHNRYEFIIRGV